jgi:hypothetical protein
MHPSTAEELPSSTKVDPPKSMPMLDTTPSTPTCMSVQSGDSVRLHKSWADEVEDAEATGLLVSHPHFLPL